MLGATVGSLLTAVGAFALNLGFAVLLSQTAQAAINRRLAQHSSADPPPSASVLALALAGFPGRATSAAALVGPGLCLAVPELLSRDGRVAAIAVAVGAVGVNVFLILVAAHAVRKVASHYAARPELVALIMRSATIGGPGDTTTDASTAQRNITTDPESLWTPGAAALTAIGAAPPAGGLRALVSPVGFWGWTVPISNTPWLWHFRSCVNVLRQATTGTAPWLPLPLCYCYAPLRYALPAVTSVLTGITLPVDGCRSIRIALAVMYLGMAAFVAVVQPHRLVILNACRALSCAALAVLAVSSALPGNVETVRAVASATTLVATVVSGVAAAANSFRERRWRKDFRRYLREQRQSQNDGQDSGPAAPLLEPPRLRRSLADPTAATAVQMQRVNPLQR